MDLNNKKAAALKYDLESQNAPKVVGKGSGYLADNIIKVATEYDIPIKKDKDMIELLSQIELNKEIPVDMYKAVAEVFSFIYDITKDKREKNEENNK